MTGKKLFLLLLLLLAGCSSIAQKNYSDSTNPSSAHTTTTIAPSANVDAAICGIKFAAGFTAATFGTSLALFTYTDCLPYPKWWLTVATGLAFAACTGYIYSLFYNRKASDKQIQQFVQRMEQAQPKEQEVCAICLEDDMEQAQPKKQEVCAICFENGNDKPLYSLPDCSCSAYFHIDCIVEHIQTTPLRLLKCPVCRIKIDMNVDTKSLTKRGSAV